VVTADGKVVVVVDVVVVTNGATQPTTGTVVPEVPVDGGHNTGTEVVVVALETTVGDNTKNAAANNGRANTERRIFHTLLMQNTHEWALEQRY
jgi:hypothetical protein